MSLRSTKVKKNLAARAPKVDSGMIYVAEEEDDDEDYVEAGGTAAVNQEIKRTITEVPVKVTDELFDEIMTKVLIRYDMTVEVDDRIITSNHKVSQISPLVLTPKVSAKVLIPVEDKETETEAVSRKSSSGSPGDVFSLGSYASDHDDEDDELQNPHVPKPICSTIQCNGTTESIDSMHRIVRRLTSPFDSAGCKYGRCCLPFEERYINFRSTCQRDGDVFAHYR